MRNNHYIESQWLDLVFEGKNKDYGAFLLRRNYVSNMNRALMIGSIIFCIGFSLLFMFNAFFKTQINITRVISCPILSIGKNQQPYWPRVYEIKRPPKTPIKFTLPIVVKDFIYVEKLPIREIELTSKLKKISFENTSSFLPDELFDFDSIINPVNKYSSSENKIVEEDSVYTFVEQEPTFENGGKDAAIKWIQRNMIFPTEDYAAGKVFVSFVIAKNGKVIDVVVVKNYLGAHYAEVAIRIIKSMPDWKPGKQNGNAVKVKVTLPISFKVEG